MNYIKIAVASAKRTKLYMFSASALRSSVFKINNNMRLRLRLRLRLHLQNKQQPNKYDTTANAASATVARSLHRPNKHH